MNKTALLLLGLGLPGCSGDVPRQTADPSEVSENIVSGTLRGSADNGEAPAGSVQVSRFTTTGLDRCKMIEKDEEQGPFYRHRCPGLGGYNYEIVEHDLRQSLVVISPSGARTDISVAAAGDGAFNSFGPTIEWRGPAGRAPHTVTLRSNFQAGEGATKSVLVVVRLAPACVVGVVGPQPQQNEKARAIADREPLPDCLDGYQ